MDIKLTRTGGFTGVPRSYDGAVTHNKFENKHGSYPIVGVENLTKQVKDELENTPENIDQADSNPHSMGFRDGFTWEISVDGLTRTLHEQQFTPATSELVNKICSLPHD